MIRTTPNKLFLLPYKFPEVEIMHLFRGDYLVSKYGNTDNWIKRNSYILLKVEKKKKNGGF